MKYNSKNNHKNEVIMNFITSGKIEYKFGSFYVDNKIVNIDEYLTKAYIQQTKEPLSITQLNTIKDNIKNISGSTVYDFDNVPFKTYMKEIAKSQNPKAIKDLKDKYADYLESIQDLSGSKQVLYLYGLGGSGKTTYAKIIAERSFQKDEIYISSGGNNPFDEYQGEKCIILDDFRDSCMKLNDLLKLLDNNTNSNVGARYHNKNLARCKCIILTSTIHPSKIYEYSLEDRYQIYRRINTFQITKRKGEILDDYEYIYTSTKLVYDVETKRYENSKKYKDITETILEYQKQNLESDIINLKDI